MENKTMDEIHRDILKKFHTLCNVLGLTDNEKHAIVNSYGVESSRDMDTHDLIDVCAKLSEQANRKAGHGETDKLRKRVMASIGAYLKAIGRESNATVIKGIACRASGYEDFNKSRKSGCGTFITPSITRSKTRGVSIALPGLWKPQPFYNLLTAAKRC